MALTQEQADHARALLTSLKMILDSHPYYSEETLEAFYNQFGQLTNDTVSSDGGGEKS